MKWKVVRLELASSWEFPRGSVGRSYLVRVPLTEDGSIDAAALECQPTRATVRRYWPNEADMTGYLVPTQQGYAIRYDVDGNKLNGGGGDEAEQDFFEFGADSIRLGEKIFLTEPDGHERCFRVASLQ